MPPGFESIYSLGAKLTMILLYELKITETVVEALQWELKWRQKVFKHIWAGCQYSY